MRIVGGRWKGRELEAPEGRAVTRPTTDRVREAMASMLLAARGLDLAGARVLDAFAGSGAIGLELLSRGAAHATFVDADARAAARVRRNAQALGADAPTWRVVRADVLDARGRSRVGGPFDIVVLDPPYVTPAGDVSALVEALLADGRLAPGCLVLYERASDAATLDLASAVSSRTKRYGTTCVDLFELGETS